jgi:hypothetical protein
MVKTLVQKLVPRIAKSAQFDDDITAVTRITMANTTLFTEAMKCFRYKKSTGMELEA